ncbi:MAG: Lrp/AsnC ligand binding domain-containing protein [Salinivirgaceae bacterium]|jgi:Lrp/AsnC family transcriptional regulator for asnA, asnC and gidA|nr:MAG: transcriptional regulator [Bacteroidetes bacterium HGW-Bacteroidetes-4]
MAGHPQIDELDKKILSLVSKNARIPYLEVARECNVSGAAIHQRIQRLIKMGVITGSEFIINPKSIGYSTCAYMGIYLQSAGLYNQVLKQLEQIPEIVECHYTTGEYSLFIKVVTRDNEHLKDILSGSLQKIDGIERTETFISLEENFKRQFPIS